MTVAKKSEQHSWKKMAPYKNVCGKKIEPKQCKKKDASYEENCGQAQYLWNNYVHLEGGNGQWKATMAILNVAAGSIWEATMAILNVATGRGQ